MSTARWTAAGECAVCGAPYWIDQAFGGDVDTLPPPLIASCRCIPQRGMPTSVRMGNVGPAVVVKDEEKKGVDEKGEPHPEDHAPVWDIALWADLGLRACVACGWKEASHDPRKED